MKKTNKKGTKNQGHMMPNMPPKGHMTKKKSYKKKGSFKSFIHK